MKKIFTISIFILLFALITFSFSCKQETIFYQIDLEQELEEAVILGTPYSITEFNNKLFCTDGLLYAKDKNAIRGWGRIETPETMEKLAASDSILYALSTTKTLYKTTDGNKWEKIDLSTTLDSIVTIFEIGNQTYLKGFPKNSTEETAAVYYSLNNTEITTTNISYEIAVVVDSQTYYVDSTGKAITNGTYTSETFETIYSLTYSPKTNALYVGTARGLKKLPLTQDGAIDSPVELPGNNYSTIIKDDYSIFATYATEYSLNGTIYEAIYASTIREGSSYTGTSGLWSYYENRNSWNCE